MEQAQKGFTLFEVMLVMVMLGILTTLVMPRGLRKAEDNYALEGSCRNLAQALRLTRETAMAEGKPTRLIFNADSWQIVRLPYGPAEVVSTYHLTQGVKMTDCALAQPRLGGTLKSPVGTVEFRPNGTLERNGWVQLQGRDGRSGLVKINSLGIIQVSLSKD